MLQSFVMYTIPSYHFCFETSIVVGVTIFLYMGFTSRREILRISSIESKGDSQAVAAIST